MVSVSMPRASWEAVIYILEDAVSQGRLIKVELHDIINQVYSQEY